MRLEPRAQSNISRLALLAFLACAVVLGIHALLTIGGGSGESPLAQIAQPTKVSASPTRTAVATLAYDSNTTPNTLISSRTPKPYATGEPPPYIPTLVPERSQSRLVDPPSPGPDDIQVHFINVGQGDSILILAPGGLVALIDGGYEGMGTLEYLQVHGVKRINLMIATHPHADHIGGLVDVLHAMPVDKVVTNGYVYTTQVYEQFLDGIAASKAEYREVHSGDTLQLGDLEFNVLSPVNGKQYSDMNQSSIVLRMVYGATSFLFTGDAGGTAERDMLASGKTLQATILKVGHHGSHTASSPEFLRAVQPVVAIYSAGKNNPYGHPHASTLENLARVGAKVYGTDVDGTVVVMANKQAYTISTRNGDGPLDLPKMPTTVVVTGRPTTTASPASTPLTRPTLQATIPARTMTPRSGSAPTATVISTTTKVPTAIPTAADRAGTVPLDGKLVLEVVSLTSPARRNSTATLKIHTEPGADCTITVMYKSGPSVARGLEPKIADLEGNVSWSWQVGGNTTPGTWKVIVASSHAGRSAYKEIPFQVIR